MARTEPGAPKAGDRSHELRWLFALLGLALVIKLVVVAQLNGQLLLQPEAGFDTTDYLTLAHRVLGGDLALGPDLYYVSPLYIYFLAAALAVLRTLTAVRVLQAGLGVVTIACVFFMAREWYGRRAAWWAAGLATFTGLLTFHEILVLQSSLDAVLVGVGLLALTRGLVGSGEPESGLKAAWRGGGRWFLVSGLAFGIQVLNRPNIGLAALALALGLLALRRWRPAVLFAGGVALALAPVVLRNVVVSHQFALVSSHGGLNFYIGNSASATGFYRQIPGIRPSVAGQAVDTKQVAEAALGHPLTDAQVSDYFFGLAWTWIAAQPAAAAWLFVRKLGDVFNAHYIALPYSYAFFAYDLRTLLAVCVVGPAVLIPLGLVGLVAGWPRGDPARARQYALWWLFVPAYAVSVAVFFMAERYRVPLLVPLAVGAGATVDRIVTATAARRWRTGAALAGAAVLLAVAANRPLGTSNGREEDELRFGELLAGKNQMAEANQWVDRAAVRSGRPAGIYAEFGQRLVETGQSAAAVAPYQRAHTLDPGNRAIELGLGQALLGAGRATEAAATLRDAIEHGARSDLSGYDLARALQQSGDTAGAVRALASVNINATGVDPHVWLDVGRLAAEMKAPAVAAPFFARAVALLPDDGPAHLQYGLDLLLLARYEEASREFTAALRLNSQDEASLSRLALCDLQLGRVADARAHAAAALRLDPTDAVAQSVLGLTGGR